MKFKRAVCFSLLCFFIQSTFAQKLTIEEGKALADQLYNVEILSDKGRTYLKEKIVTNEFDRPITHFIEFGGPQIQKGLSKSQVLIYLRDAFWTDYYYRSGIKELKKILTKLGPLEMTGNLTKEEADERVKEYHRKIDGMMADFIGIKIEDSIPFEGDSSVVGGDIFFMSSGLNLLDETHLIHLKRSVTGKTKSRTLKDLFDLGLINKFTFENIKKRGFLYPMNEYKLLDLVVEEMMRFEDLAEHQNNVRLYVQHLHEKGVIPKENSAAVSTRLLQFPPTQLFDLAPYFNRGRIFKLDDFDPSAEVGYQQIFETIKSIVPNFEFRDFQSEVEYINDPWGGDLVESKIKIQFAAKDRIYQSDVFLDFHSKRRIQKNEPLKVSGDFHKIVNNYLVDEGASYRLFYIKKKNVFDSLFEEDEFGLVLLNKNEFDALGEVNTEQYLSHEDFDLSFSTMQIEKSTDAFMEIGLFAHLTPSEISEGMDCVYTSHIEEYATILMCFENIVAHFALETGNYKNPYEELTRKFALISRGAFRPERIIDTFGDNWGKEFTNFGFELGNKKYEIQLNSNYDWLDPEFMTLIKRAMLENDVEGKLYYCFDDGEALGYIFLNDKQYGFLKENYRELFPYLEEGN